MTASTATVIAALIGALGVVFAALISKYELLPIFKTTKFNLTGAWHGMSIYVPIDIYNIGSECVYKFCADINQYGGKISFYEKITDFYDIDLTKIEDHSPRIIKGKGKVLGDKDVIIQFKEKNSLTCGTMYLTIDTWGKELQGVLAVRNPYFGTPAVVKIVLRRASEKDVTPNDLGIAWVKCMAETLLEQQKIKKSNPNKENSLDTENHAAD